MKIDWALLSEGATRDGRGAYAAIGISQNVVIAPRLPASIKRVLLLQASGEVGEFRAGQKIAVDVSCMAPSGKVLSAKGNRGEVGGAKWEGLPPNVVLSAAIELATDDYGVHTVRVELQLDNSPPVVAEVELYVVDGLTETKSHEASEAPRVE